jgi:DNA-binding GntR family transcriptional regulator
VRTAGISGAGYREIAQALRELIQSGELAPGAPVPAESEVCRSWSVSRVTARRALGVLEEEGLVDTVAGRGRFVKRNSQHQARSGSRAEEIATEVRDAVRSGKLAAGSRIDSEATLSERHGVARGTAREALLLLDREGLTTIVRGRGRFVASTTEVQSTTRADEIAHGLELGIAEGDMRAGDRVPGELSLAEQYGAARSTVRRALEILERKGLIAKLPGKPRIVLGGDGISGKAPE